MKYIRSPKLFEKYLDDSLFESYFGFDIKPYTTMLQFDPDDVILKEGEVPTRLYYMFEGRAKLFITHKNGSVSLINFLEGPCFIGEMELLTENRPANGVVAISNCLCFSVNVADCKDLLLNDVIFLRHLCHILSQKALTDISTYTKNQSYPLKVRLASFILMTQHNGVYRERHTEASGFLGVTYRHFLYVLGEFVKDGILKKEASGYKIVKRQELEKLAEQQ